MLSRRGPHSPDGTLGWHFPGLERWAGARFHESSKMPILTGRSGLIPEGHASDRSSGHQDVCKRSKENKQGLEEEEKGK